MFSLIILSVVIYHVSGGDYVQDIMSHPNWRYLDQDSCGIVKVIPKITKGEPVKIALFPWTAQILRRQRKLPHHRHRVEKFVCGGALINERFVVTAAHCVHNEERHTKSVHFGESLNVDEGCQQGNCLDGRFKIDKIIVHEKFNATSLENDIALILMEEDIKYGDRVRPICLLSGDLIGHPFYAQTVEIAGWGMDSNEVLSGVLKFVTLPIRDRCVCQSIYNQEIDERRLCIGVDTGEDTCVGDSGSPVVWSREERFTKKHYMIGLTSLKRVEPHGPAVYTNMAKYVKWILDNIFDDDDDYESDSYEPYPTISDKNKTMPSQPNIPVPPDSSDDTSSNESSKNDSGSSEEPPYFKYYDSV